MSLGPGLQRLYLLMAAVVGLVLLLDAVPAIHTTVATWYPPDLVVDHRTARAYKEGFSPYDAEGARRAHLAELGPSGTGHPPTTSFWVLPLADLDLKTANAAVCWISLFLLLLELVLLAQSLRCPAPHATAWLAFGFLVSCPLLAYHASLGQLSQAIAFLYVTAWLAWRRDDQILAGIALGAACTMKFFPAVMVLLLVVGRRWRGVLAAAAVFALVAAVMTARFGLAAWPAFFAQQSVVADEWLNNISNLSLHGIIGRLFSPACLPPGPVRIGPLVLSSLLSLGLLAAAAWWSRRLAREGRTVDLPFAAFTVLSVLLGQWAWEHYALILVPAAAIATTELVAAWRSGSRVPALIGLAGVALSVALWRAEITTKLAHQRAHWRGVPGEHFALHLHEVLNWLPGVLLLGVSLWLLWRAQRTEYKATPV
jgi:alpha-1,2-mannosyltransferase